MSNSQANWRKSIVLSPIDKISEPRMGSTIYDIYHWKEATNEEYEIEFNY